jgi:hypothetical protein
VFPALKSAAAGQGAAKVSSPSGSQRGSLFSLFLLALVLRLFFVYFGQNNGGDAWGRYQLSQKWLAHPGHLPSTVWLPLHFWLLGSALWVWNSEWSARILTAILGALTVLPYWGIVRRLFDEEVAFYSTLLLSLFAFHIGYSATTSAEVPLLFFLTLGIYGWVRFREGSGWWLLLCGPAFSFASLIKFEAWPFNFVLGGLLLDFSQRWSSLGSNRRAWGQAAKFVLASSAGALGWMFFSLLKWNHLFAFVSESLRIGRGLPPVLRSDLIYRIFSQPGALAITLSPLVAGLIAAGLLGEVVRRRWLQLALAVPALVVGSVWFYLSITGNATMARYTLSYSWLLIPYAVEGLRWLSLKWDWLANRRTFSGLLAFSLFWQVGVVAGAHYGSGVIADKLSSVSPTLPLTLDLRGVTGWLKANVSRGNTVIVDDRNCEGSAIIRYSGIVASQAFLVPCRPDGELDSNELGSFIRNRGPSVLVYSPIGELPKLWRLDAETHVEFGGVQMRLRLLWKSNNYRVYHIEYLR